MSQVSICQLSSSRWTFQKDLNHYDSIGCQSLGIWRTKLDDVGAQEAADLLFEMKMTASSLHWCGGFTGSTGMSYVESVNDSISAVKLAGMLGAETLILYPGSRNGHTDRHSRRLIDSALNALVPIAADYGVRLALEPMKAPANCPWTFFDGLSPVLDLIQEFDPAEVGIVLDLFHMGTDFQLLERLDMIRERIALVQLGNRSYAGDFAGPRCPLSRGIVPIKAWLHRLAEIDYRGFYEIESWGFADSNQYQNVLESEYDFVMNQLELVAEEAKKSSSM